MKNVGGHQGENERQLKKKKRNAYDISAIKRVSRVTLYSCKTTGKKCTRKYAARAKLCFC